METADCLTQLHQWKSAEPGERVARKQLLCTLFPPHPPVSWPASLLCSVYSLILVFSLPIKSVGPWTSRNSSQPTVLPCSHDETRRYIGRARPARAACPRGAPQGSACLAPSSLSIFFLLPSSFLRTQMSAESHFSNVHLQNQYFQTKSCKRHEICQIFHGFAPSVLFLTLSPSWASWNDDREAEKEKTRQDREGRSRREAPRRQRGGAHCGPTLLGGHPSAHRCVLRA